MTSARPPVAVRRPASSLGGLWTSLLVHGLLVGLACWVVLRSVSEPGRSDRSEVFVSAGGGAASGPVIPQSARQRSFPVQPRRCPSRISARTGSSAIALPPPRPPESFSPADPLTRTGLAATAGSHGVAGLGQAFGKGMGLGSARGFAPRPVMGALIRAQRVAVYLDCSGSMRPYLERVESEIRREFPDADVFRFDGARIVGLDDDVVYGRSFRGTAPRLTEGPSQTQAESLTERGRQLFARIREPCEKGSLGAWLDRLQVEPYDALVVFSDFQDGVRIYHDLPRSGPRLVYSDSSYHPLAGPRQAAYRWELSWLERFARAPAGGAPRLYLFSVSREPQAFLQRCVRVSGGGSVSVDWLRPSKVR